MSAVDTHVESHRWPAGIDCSELTRETVAAADIVVLLTEHDEFDLGLLGEGSTLVLDTKNCVPATSTRVHRL